MSKRMSRWMPWSDFALLGHEILEKSNGAVIPAGLLALGTVIASTALPYLSLPISILGGLLIVATVAAATGQYHELVEGLAEIGGMPSGIAVARLLWQLTLTDLQRLWHGNAHSEQIRLTQQRATRHQLERKAGDDREGIEA